MFSMVCRHKQRHLCRFMTTFMPFINDIYAVDNLKQSEILRKDDIYAGFFKGKCG